MKNIIVQNVQKALLFVVLCVGSYDVFAAESRISPADYGTFAYTIIMTQPWSEPMKNMIKISWEGWSPQQRAEIAQRVAGKTVLPGGIVAPPAGEKLISRAEYQTVAYVNIMNKPWISSFGNLVDNCWDGWSERERSDITKRMHAQGIQHTISKPKERMLRHDT